VKQNDRLGERTELRGTPEGKSSEGDLVKREWNEKRN